MRTRRDWKSASPLAPLSPSMDAQPSTSAQSPSPLAPMSSVSTIRKNWTVAALVKYDDFWKFDKLLTDRQINPTRVLADQCYTYFASANVLKVLVKHGAPMTPERDIELEPLSHYVIAYVLMEKTMGYKDKKKFLEVIQYLKEEGHPIEPTLHSLTIMNAPSDHEVYTLLTPPPSRDPSPSLSHSTTASSVSTPPPLDVQTEDGEKKEKTEMLITIDKRKRNSSGGSTSSKRSRH